MNCRECQEVLQRRLDGVVAGSVELERHLADCPSCRRDHRAAQMMGDALRQLPRPVLPPNFARQITTAVLEDRVVRQRRLKIRLWTTAAMAAAILLMAWGGYLWLPEQPTQPVIVQKNPVDSPPQSEPGPAPLAQSVDEARVAVAALTDRFADQTKNQARLLIAAAPMDVPMGVPDLPLDDPLDPAAQSLLQASLGFSEGFTTVARNARRAVDYLVKDLPSIEVSN